MQNLFLDSKVTQYGSHMVMTDSRLPPRSVYINIDSRFRDDSNQSTLADYTFTLPQKINGIHSMQVISAEIPYTINNFSSSYNNNVFYISCTKNNITKEKSITVPTGYYNSISDVVSSINTQIQDLDASYNSFALSYYKESDATGLYKCILDNSAGLNPIQLYFNHKNTLDRVGGGGGDTRNTLGWKLGFRDTKYYIESGQTISGESFADILSPKYLYLVIEDYTKSSAMNSFTCPFYMSIMNKNIIAKFPISAAAFTGVKYSYGSMINLNLVNGTLVSDTRTYSGGDGIDIQKLRIQLVDEFGKIVDLNQMDFSVCLKLNL